jgi:hypothetical protein
MKRLTIDGIVVRYWREGDMWHVRLFAGPNGSALVAEFWTQGKEREAVADAREEVAKYTARQAATA